MKLLYILAGILILTACKNEKKSIGISNIASPEKAHFFPVTEYLKGQIFEIKNGGINPLKINNSNGTPDSSWLKMEQLENEVKDFLYPEIDSTNLRSMFSEIKFMDQTLDAITLSYDPVKVLPDSVYLKHWDVYIDPGSGKVKRIYLVKALSKRKSELLTWTSGKKCNIVVVADSSNSKPSVEKNITIQWSF